MSMSANIYWTLSRVIYDKIWITSGFCPILIFYFVILFSLFHLLIVLITRAISALTKVIYLDYMFISYTIKV